MNLEIFSPEKILYRGEATSVTLPGVLGAFTVLDHHAPIISPLVKGEISYRVKEDISHISIEKGFVELNNNKVTVCVEISSEK